MYAFWESLERSSSRLAPDVYALDPCLCRDAGEEPDYPFNRCSKTISAAEELADAVKAAGFKTMFVPQSVTGDIEDWINGYRWAAGNPAIDIIGMSILGVPNAIPHANYVSVC